MSILTQAKEARRALQVFATATSAAKNEALGAVGRALKQGQQEILRANREDLANAEKKGIPFSLRDRLLLTESRLEEIITGIHNTMTLPDPIGEQLESRTLDNGLRIDKIRIPIGLIGMIYEARPNVTVEAVGIALKTGNGILLRGSSSASASNSMLVKIIRQALEKTALPPPGVQLIADPDRQTVRDLLTAKGLVDLLIPRGGRELIQRVVNEATVPVLETGEGICHMVIDRTADYSMAEQIVINAKTSRPGVCNAIETLLVHQDWAKKHLARLGEALRRKEVELRGCPITQSLLPFAKEAMEADWEAEYLDKILAIKVVTSLKEALAHIEQYGSRHSEGIITEEGEAVQRFMTTVDAAAVYHNASTRFTDGGQFGMGGEMGISTQKLHARGPIGLKELTSYQYRLFGTGQIRE